MNINNIKLVDIGNTHAKIFFNNKITTIKAEDFELCEDFWYICVNEKVKDKLIKNPYANDLERYIKLDTFYQGLGVDRKVLCSYIKDGVIVDAGSAITIDLMHNLTHKGGYIFPGIKTMFKSYISISKSLDVKKIKSDISKLPQNTIEAVNNAIIKSVVLLIKDVSKDKKIYFCGGDGEMLSSYFENSFFQEDLIFKAMKNIIKDL